MILVHFVLFLINKCISDKHFYSFLITFSFPRQAKQKYIMVNNFIPVFILDQHSNSDKAIHSDRERDFKGFSVGSLSTVFSPLKCPLCGTFSHNEALCCRFLHRKINITLVISFTQPYSIRFKQTDMKSNSLKYSHCLIVRQHPSQKLRINNALFIKNVKTFLLIMYVHQGRSMTLL